VIYGMICDIQLKLVLKILVFGWIATCWNKLNNDKSKLIVFSSKQHVKKTEDLHIKVGSTYINSSMPVRNLGLILDKTLGIRHGVNSILSIPNQIYQFQIDQFQFHLIFFLFRNCPSIPIPELPINSNSRNELTLGLLLLGVQK